MNATTENIGLRLRKLRMGRRKSQHVLAATLQRFNVQVTRNMLANWETCRGDVPARLIPYLAYALDADVADFLPDLNPHQINELVRGRIVVDVRGEKNVRYDRFAPTASKSAFEAAAILPSCVPSPCPESPTEMAIGASDGTAASRSGA